MKTAVLRNQVKTISEPKKDNVKLDLTEMRSYYNTVQWWILANMIIKLPTLQNHTISEYAEQYELLEKGFTQDGY